jgi:arylsulfatase A-like enzyme
MTKIGAFVALLAGFVAAPSPAAEIRRPDVLFIAIDDLNDWVGVLGGHPQALTPNIDALAARGMLFTNAHTPGTSCNPARTAILTGLAPATTGIYNNGGDWRYVEALRTIPTLPRYFRNHGYRAVGAGKIFHAHTYNPAGFYGYNDLDGWDAFYPSIHRQLPDEVVPAIRPVNGSPVTSTGFDWSPLVIDDDVMGDGRVVSWATRELAEETSAPRFVAAGIYRPHLPWYVPQQYFDMHPLSDIVLPPTLDNDLADVPEIAHGVRNLDGVDNHKWVLAQGNWKRGVQAYLASISFADAMVGRLIEALDASGRADDTLIVLWSDHGFHLGEKERWRKWTLWQRTTHVPLIIVAPGVTTPGSRGAQAVSLLDLYPTLAELARLPTPSHLEGNSLLPLLSDPQAEWEHGAVTNNGYLEHSVRDVRYRYTRHADGSEELYDVSSDPNEWHNLASDSEWIPVKARLARWLPSVNAPSVTPGRN